MVTKGICRMLLSLISRLSRTLSGRNGKGLALILLALLMVAPAVSGLALARPFAPPDVAAPIPLSPRADLAAFHRAGQTFLTWPEVPDGVVVTYRIYRQPESPESGLVGEPVAEVPQGSAAFWTERGRSLIALDRAVYPGLNNYVITDFGPQLADGTGLLVWTTHDPGVFFYHILPVIAGTPDPGRAMTVGPVGEAPATPQPVLVWQTGDGRGRVYTQFLDYAAYNLTFDAPRAGNQWYGLGLSGSGLAPYFQQYAYSYFVGLPTDQQCGGQVWDRLPLILEMVPWGSRYAVYTNSPWFCATHIITDDPSQSWYFGFSAGHDYRTGAPVMAGPIVNYSEQRLLRTVAEVMGNPTFRVDPERVYAYGHSMGGTGALMLGERYPNVFAAIYASQPMINFASSAYFLAELEAKWGTRGRNLPVAIQGPYAGHVAGFSGLGVWDWQNLAAPLNQRRGAEMAYIWISHGTQDRVIDWATVARPVYETLELGDRAYLGRIDAVDHIWVDLPHDPMGGFATMGIRRNESLPAFSNASGSLPVPPTGPGYYNQTLEWSTWWADFGALPVDLPAMWAVLVRTTDGSTQTVDITPRRVQHFVVTPGAVYRWRNEARDGSVIDFGTVVADRDGLVTVEAFLVTPDGNRLVIEP